MPTPQIFAESNDAQGVPFREIFDKKEIKRLDFQTYLIPSGDLEGDTQADTEKNDLDEYAHNVIYQEKLNKLRLRGR